MLREVHLGLRVGLHMARAWPQPAGAEAAQGAPAQVTTDTASEAPAEPGGHGPSAPAVTLGMRASHGCSQRRQVWGWQVWPPGTQRVAPVTHTLWAVGVVASGDLAKPVSRIAGHRGHSGRRHAASQQPEEVPVAAFDWITCMAIAVMEFVIGQMGFETDASWHAPVLQQHAATPYQTGS